MGYFFEVVDDVPVDDVGQPSAKGFGFPMASGLFNLEGQLAEGFLSDLLGLLRRQATLRAVVQDWGSVCR